MPAGLPRRSLGEGGHDDDSGHAAGPFAFDAVRIEDVGMRHGAEAAQVNALARQGPHRSADRCWRPTDRDTACPAPAEPSIDAGLRMAGLEKCRDQRFADFIVARPDARSDRRNQIGRVGAELAPHRLDRTARQRARTCRASRHESPRRRRERDRTRESARSRPPSPPARARLRSTRSHRRPDAARARRLGHLASLEHANDIAVHLLDAHQAIGRRAD